MQSARLNPDLLREARGSVPRMCFTLHRAHGAKQQGIRGERVPLRGERVPLRRERVPLRAERVTHQCSNPSSKVTSCFLVSDVSKNSKHAPSLARKEKALHALAVSATVSQKIEHSASEPTPVVEVSSTLSSPRPSTIGPVNREKKHGGGVVVVVVLVLVSVEVVSVAVVVPH